MHRSRTPDRIYLSARHVSATDQKVILDESGNASGLSKLTYNDNASKIITSAKKTHEF